MPRIELNNYDPNSGLFIIQHKGITEIRVVGAGDVIEIKTIQCTVKINEDMSETDSN